MFAGIGWAGGLPRLFSRSGQSPCLAHKRPLVASGPLYLKTANRWLAFATWTRNLENVARRGIERSSQIVAASSTVPRFRWSMMVNGGGCVVVIHRETGHLEKSLILILKPRTATNASRSSLFENAEPLTNRGAQPNNKGYWRGCQAMHSLARRGIE
jgi:hypothetical protein